MIKNAIKGQDRVINFLMNSLRNGRLASAYLFIGPSGVGKSLVAKELAKILNCKLKEFDSCAECSSCLKIENNSHPALHWIEAGSSGFIKIEDIRALERDIYLKPFEARKKVYVIQDAERMTEEANNALLKTLEEPPSDSIIILITSKLHSIFSTIISRCQKVYFSLFSRQDLEQLLIKEYSLNQAKSRFIASFSEGRLGRALQIKDRDILKEKNRIIDIFLPATSLDKFNANFQYGSKVDVEEILGVLVNWFRDILRIKAGFSSQELMNIDRLEDLQELKSRYSFNDIFEITDLIIKLHRLLRVNINAKIALTQIKEKICRK